MGSSLGIMAFPNQEIFQNKEHMSFMIHYPLFFQYYVIEFTSLSQGEGRGLAIVHNVFTQGSQQGTNNPTG